MDELIEQNMGLVIRIVNSFGPKNHTEREDLIDAGRIGLWKALKKYKKENGLISTYAWRPIRWSIIREIKNRKSYVSIDSISPPIVNNKENLWECYSDDMTEEEILLIELRQQGYKFHEICSILQEKPSRIKNKFYRLIKRLRESNAE
jgi:RNA polymerase sigma factor (sigma-70 family)